MSLKKIAILDYGIGNVQSMCNAIEKVGAVPILTNNEDEIMGSAALILPGVGAFEKGMKNLIDYKLVDVIHKFVKTGKPFLGVCLGMQMLLEKSEEFGETKGLGLIKGKVVKLNLKNESKAKLPHISWNSITDPAASKWKNTLLEETEAGANVYFVHSFVAQPENREEILASAIYDGVEFCAAIKRNNVYGTQFHPEKSGEAGLKMLKKFVQLI